MKRFCIALLLFTPLTLFAYTSPGQPTGYVNDFGGMLKSETISSLNQELTNFTQTNGSEISVVTIPKLTEETIDTYAVKLFQDWGIGQKGKDNGVLLLISRDDRKMRIEVGYGLEPVITDIESAHIISEVIEPQFKNGNFDEGVTLAVRRLETDITNGVPPEPRKSTMPGLNFLSNNIVFVLIFLTYLTSILARSKSWWAGGIVGAVIGFIFFSIIGAGILGILGLVLDYFVSKSFEKHKDNGTRPPWFIGGGGMGGGRGSGFGGFGGGGSGGGGSSGGW